MKLKLSIIALWVCCCCCAQIVVANDLVAVSTGRLKMQDSHKCKDQTVSDFPSLHFQRPVARYYVVSINTVVVIM